MLGPPEMVNMAWATGVCVIAVVVVLLMLAVVAVGVAEFHDGPQQLGQFSTV